MCSKIACIVVIASLVWIGLVMLANSQQAEPISQVCLGCICEATTGCNQSKSCTGVACGLFHITYDYWSEAGMLTLDGESKTSDTAYPNCVYDAKCAANTITDFMDKFGRDCNEDNKIDCYDYASIHQLGPYGCTAGIHGKYLKDLNQCLDYYGYENETGKIWI